MTVTRDIVMDLLPVYLAGEASADTKAVVERFRESDPEIRALLEAEMAFDLPPVPYTPLSQESEMEMLETTKRLLRQRSLLMGFAMFFTGLPFAFQFGADGVRWLWEGAPAEAMLMGLVAVGFWAGYAATNRRLRGTQL